MKRLWNSLAVNLEHSGSLAQAQDDIEALWAKLSPREFHNVGGYYLTGFLRGCAGPGIPSADLEKVAFQAIREFSAVLEDDVHYEPTRAN